MIAMFDIFTLLYKEAKELISKWFYRFPKGKTQKCSSSHQFMLQRKGIYGRNESGGKAKNGAKKQRYCRKRTLTYVAYSYTFIYRQKIKMLYYKSLMQNKLQVQY